MTFLRAGRSWHAWSCPRSRGRDSNQDKTGFDPNQSFVVPEEVDAFWKTFSRCLEALASCFYHSLLNRIILMLQEVSLECTFPRDSRTYWRLSRFDSFKQNLLEIFIESPQIIHVEITCESVWENMPCLLVERAFLRMECWFLSLLLSWASSLWVRLAACSRHVSQEFMRAKLN